ncbi:MAG: phosphoribosyltransferase [Gemmatimonadaceae bacterium]|nr:phosphoribosyltransferase [Gemmatimonadaceae bacterium]
MQQFEAGVVMTMKFRDRLDAGRQLASRLAEYADRTDVLVLGLPRGGVPVAFEVARALSAPLDVFVVRKLGLPHHEELAMGAIAMGGARVLDRALIAQVGVSDAEIEQVTRREEIELERRQKQYRGDRPLPDIAGRTVILVDDGLATGSSMRVAVAALREEHPRKIVVAVPIAPEETCEMLRGAADEVVCALTPEPFYAVGLWYRDFSQTSDEEVHDLIERSREELVPAPFPRR